MRAQLLEDAPIVDEHILELRTRNTKFLEVLNDEKPLLAVALLQRGVDEIQEPVEKIDKRREAVESISTISCDRLLAYLISPLILANSPNKLAHSEPFLSPTPASALPPTELISD